MLKTAKIVGLNSDTEAALALSCGESVKFLALITCAVEDAFSRARQALAEAESNFFSSEHVISERLGETWELVQKSLADTENLQILLSAVTEDEGGHVLYLFGGGERLRGFLIRDGKENDLLGESEGKLVSGVLEGGDRVVLATKSLLEFLGKSQLLKETPIHLLEDEINANLPEAENYPVAAIILETAKTKVEEIKEDIPDVNKSEKVMVISKRHMLFGAVGILLIILGGLGFSFIKRGQEAPKLAQLSGQSAPVPTQDPKVIPVADFPLWLDLNLIKEGFETQELSLSLGKLLLFDGQQKTLVTITLENKSHQILAGKEKLGEVKHAAINGDLSWVFSGDKGLLRVDEDKKVLVVEKLDEEWGEIAQIFGFARNAYLLDKKGQVWKYVPVEGGYSEKIAYFKEGVKVDLSEAKRMQIDSSVWVLKNNGEILKFTQGESDYFSFSGLDKGVKDIRSFFVSDETDNVYILDSGNNRLLVVDKKGAYVSQYQGDKFGLFEDLVVDEGGKKAYLLDEGKIYLLELK